MTLRSEVKPSGKVVKKAKLSNPAQMGLFDQPIPTESSAAKPSSIPNIPAPVRAAAPRQPIVSQTAALTVDDMPDYPAHLVASVEQTIRDAPTDRVLLTYRDIQDFFGVSRATVARRMKEGLIPGIRLLHGRVLDDGPVRRLDRTQVKWLLLAVRVRHGAVAQPG
ncbi:MAG: hypothetical protein FD124_3335 [Alphaproteobacteria bacterium]|nr:MAG: hypothetical protein FD160_1256 [Caulobacteraceae bacterium]TPW02611.1 MAG: hypothetical protein FD124_3335 [Alphaproteobacteria bacterium]